MGYDPEPKSMPMHATPTLIVATSGLDVCRVSTDYVRTTETMTLINKF